MGKRGTWRVTALAATVVLAARGDAQEARRDAAAPYGSVTIALSAAQPVAEGALEPWWDAGRGVRLDVRIPFYVGDVGAWVMRVPYTARAETQPDFDAYVVALEWRFAPFATSRVRPWAGIGAGNFLTTFDGVETKGLGKESEILVEASGGVSLRVARATSVTAGVTGLQVLTSTPIRLAFATVGVSHTVRTPGWLRGVIE
jgi:hypothetical protein